LLFFGQDSDKGEHDKDDSFEDKIDGDLNNLLNQVSILFIFVVD
jgi:hypothetical protein